MQRKQKSFCHLFFSTDELWPCSQSEIDPILYNLYWFVRNHPWFWNCIQTVQKRCGVLAKACESIAFRIFFSCNKYKRLAQLCRTYIPNVGVGGVFCGAPRRVADSLLLPSVSSIRLRCINIIVRDVGHFSWRCRVMGVYY